MDDDCYVEATSFLRDTVYAFAPAESETKSCERCGIQLESRSPFGPGSRPLWVEVTDKMDHELIVHTLDRCIPGVQGRSR